MNYNSLHAQLAAFPHIQRSLDTLWPGKRCRDYLWELMSPSRTDRQGFPQDAFLAIYKLLELHDRDFPEFKPGSDTWDFDTYRLR